VTAAPVLTPQPVTLGVAGSRDYVDDWGNLVIVCDLRNDTPYLVEKVQVRATLYGEDGSALDRESVVPLLRRISPWGQAPAIVVLKGGQAWGNYALQATGWTRSSAPESGLVLVASEAYTGDAGLYHVWGQVRNEGTRAQTYPRVVVTLYDGEGKVVNACLSHTIPETLVPGGKGVFNCSFDFARGAARHTVQIEGD